MALSCLSCLRSRSKCTLSANQLLPPHPHQPSGDPTSHGGHCVTSGSCLMAPQCKSGHGAEGPLFLPLLLASPDVCFAFCRRSRRHQGGEFHREGDTPGTTVSQSQRRECEREFQPSDPGVSVYRIRGQADQVPGVLADQRDRTRAQDTTREQRPQRPGPTHLLMYSAFSCSPQVLHLKQPRCQCLSRATRDCPFFISAPQPPQPGRKTGAQTSAVGGGGAQHGGGGGPGTGLRS